MDIECCYMSSNIKIGVVAVFTSVERHDSLNIVCNESFAISFVRASE